MNQLARGFFVSAMDVGDEADQIVQLKERVYLNDQLFGGRCRKLNFCWQEPEWALIHFQANLHHIHKEEGFFCNITEASTEISNVFEGFDVPHIDPGIFTFIQPPYDGTFDSMKRLK